MSASDTVSEVAMGAILRSSSSRRSKPSRCRHRHAQCRNLTNTGVLVYGTPCENNYLARAATVSGSSATITQGQFAMADGHDVVPGRQEAEPQSYLPCNARINNSSGSPVHPCYHFTRPGP
ncbi:uncharacterized protein LOC62_04G006218 [Vanrija pseudolonga]|uniref:Uncharacterized protein n=1 Tax=Vanrija pseudolonga TaxID=143232 RepID=A0AAF1BJH0_9TREE|nr:hypothetical protein LOC62_04G006218 [Vanrija pseudolonga]